MAFRFIKFSLILFVFTGAVVSVRADSYLQQDELVVSTNGIVYKNSKTGIGLASPQAELEVNKKTKFNQSVSFKLVSQNVSSGGTKTVNWNEGNKQVLSINTASAVQVTFTEPENPDGTPLVARLVLVLQHSDTGNVTFTDPLIEWPLDKVPTFNTAAGVTDIINFFYDGTRYYGRHNNGYVEP